MICNDFANFCKESCIKILACKLDIQRIEKGEDEYINKVEQSKIVISNTMHLESQYYWGKLMEIRKNILISLYQVSTKEPVCGENPCTGSFTFLGSLWGQKKRFAESY